MRWHVSGGGGKENIHLPIMLLERFIGGGVAAYTYSWIGDAYTYIYTLYIRVEWFSTIFRILKTTQGWWSGIYYLYRSTIPKNQQFSRGKVFIFNKSHWPKKLIKSFGILQKTFLILQRTIAKTKILIWKLLNIFFYFTKMGITVFDHNKNKVSL